MSRLVADLGLFFEFAEDTTVDPDMAMNWLETISATVDDLSPGDHARFAAIIEEMASSADNGRHAEFLRKLVRPS